MTAKDYKVKHPYGATYSPWSKAHPHRGNDRGCKSGTEVTIGDTVIGLTGNTGQSSAPHLHTQAGSDLGCQITFKPDSLEFKPGRVVATRSSDTGAWGKYVTIKVAEKKYITYAHLSIVNVSVGTVVKAKEKDMFLGHSAEHYYKRAKEEKARADKLQKALNEAQKVIEHHQSKRRTLQKLYDKLKGKK